VADLKVGLYEDVTLPQCRGQPSGWPALHAIPLAASRYRWRDIPEL